jgi:hypothetical protein
LAEGLDTANARSLEKSQTDHADRNSGQLKLVLSWDVRLGSIGQQSDNRITVCVDEGFL